MSIENLTKVTLAPNINIRWDPVTDEGNIRLELRDYLLTSNNEVTDYANLKYADMYNISISDILTKTANTHSISDPVTGNNLPPEMSGAMVMYSIKRLLDNIILERKMERVLYNIVFDVNFNSPNNVVIDLSRTILPDNDTIVTIRADYGDGSNVDVITNSLILDHTYSVSGQYTINLDIDTNQYANLNKSISITID